MALMFLHEGLEMGETMIVARLGGEALAAVTLCAPIQMLIYAVAGATGVGVNSLLARCLGAGRLQDCNNIAWHTLIIGLICGVVLTGIGQAGLDFMLQLIGADAATLVLCEDYLRIFLWGAPFILLSFLLSSLVLGEGSTMLPMLGYVLSAGIDVVMDIVLIWGAGWIPAFGFEGAAGASVVAHAGSVMFLGSVLRRKASVMRWQVRDFHLDISILRAIYRLALPVLVVELLNAGIMLILNRTLIQYHYTAVAVLGIFQHSRALFLLPINSLTNSVTPIAGYAYGARRYDRVKETLMKGAIWAAMLLTAGWAAMQFCGEEIMRCFTSDPLQIAHGVQGFQLATLVLPLLGPTIVFTTVLQAVGKGFLALCFSALRQAGLFLPAIFILPKIFGLAGVWLAFSVSEALTIVLMGGFFYYFWYDLSSAHLRSGFHGRYWLRRLRRWLQW
jgi:putative MATE family efflux protein